MRRAGGFIGMVLVAAFAVALAAPKGLAEAPAVKVYKSPTCGCCTKWVEHLRAAGFSVQATDVESMEHVKRMNGVPWRLSSCHTAFVGGYFIEGHVPAEDVKRLLEEQPDVAGIAVPGMPVGSPGMEAPDPAAHEAYKVLALDADGGVSVFASHHP